MAAITIENEQLRVTVQTEGGGLSGVYDKRTGEELFYDRDPRAWTESDVIIFPFVGRLRGGYYTLDGKRYEMKTHGVLRYKPFNVRARSADTVVLDNVADEATRAAYPFDFAYSVTYSLAGNRLTTTLCAENTGSKTMPFMLGGHPAYALDRVEKENETDTAGNYIRFDKTLPLSYYTLDETGGYITGTAPFENTGEIELSKAFFRKYDTLMLMGVKGPVTLKRKRYELIFDIGEPPVLALWSYPDFGAYVCVEPWYGRPDSVEPERELTRKPEMRFLEPGKRFAYTYSVEIRNV